MAARHGRRSPHRLAARMVESRCLAFRRTDPAFEPSLRQHRSPLSGNAILRGRAGAETAPEIQSTGCRDKMRARILAGSGLFAMNREISVCVRLHGGPGRTKRISVHCYWGKSPSRVFAPLALFKGGQAVARSTLTFCVMRAGTHLQTGATTRGLYKLTLSTATSNTRSDIPSCRRRGSRISGGSDP